MADDGVAVLLVDDEQFLLEVLQDALEEADFKVLRASDSESALATFKKEGAHVRGLITDIDLGSSSLSGWDIARKARVLNPHLPVLYMTGGSANDWASKGVPDSLLLAKPFATAQLITGLAQLLNAVPPPSD